MQARSRNLLVWIAVVAVAGLLWFFVARTRLHFIDPFKFVIVIAVAAAFLTGLLWWDVRCEGEETEQSS
jgi:hypothetical protein